MAAVLILPVSNSGKVARKVREAFQLLGVRVDRAFLRQFAVAP